MYFHLDFDAKYWTDQFNKFCKIKRKKIFYTNYISKLNN